MLTLHYQCVQCGVRLSIDPLGPGKSLGCPNCESEMAPAVTVAQTELDPDVFEFGIAGENEDDSIFGSQTSPDDPFSETTPVVEIPAVNELRPIIPPQPAAWSNLPPLPVRSRRHRTPLATYLLIFLIPYAILTTAIVAYLLSTR